MRLLVGILMGSLPLLAAGCGQGADAPPREPTHEEGIPVPDLDHVDPDVVEAIQTARDAVRAAPDSADAWGRLGNRYFVHDFLPEAARCFERAEALDPARTVWTYRHGLCHIDDDPAVAARDFERCLETLETHAPAHENYAYVLRRLGREDEAMRHFERASELDPRAPQAETGLGQIELGRGELEKARVHLEAALARDPRFAAAHVALAQVYLGLGRDEEAREHAELSRRLPQRVVREDVYADPSLPPAGARARTAFGKQLERRGQLDEAAEQFRIALRSNPDAYGARSGLASVLAKLGRRDEAIELLLEAQRRNPKLQQVKRDLARLRDPGASFDAGSDDSPEDGEE